ncbi:MAG: hypothetical protein JXQ27_12695 [Acidobacteria bacterium]|nr:hypothetical protein [Acidobacteriota bacterium]
MIHFDPAQQPQLLGRLQEAVPGVELPTVRQVFSSFQPPGQDIAQLADKLVQTLPDKLSFLPGRDLEGAIDRQKAFPSALADAGRARSTPEQLASSMAKVANGLQALPNSDGFGALRETVARLVSLFQAQQDMTGQLSLRLLMSASSNPALAGHDAAAVNINNSHRGVNEAAVNINNSHRGIDEAAVNINNSHRGIDEAAVNINNSHRTLE